ncbi:hypothetical protein Dsin_009790 [Dipteronia sinensis]|uniref:FAR1 domain-containing protein n=1 Tax=Dipteronia sinensis TaxID=43782 RepID=A0AAE0AS78_9ROSI|nr:hypothetical protein Dsin_009790 [Dipteronia sinensis]
MAVDDNTITERRETNTRICWDLNKIPNVEENGGDLNENIQDLVKNDMKQFAGQCFLSEEEAFTFYKNYANQYGFSIRKGRFISNNGEVRICDFFCHREGKPDSKFVDPSKHHRDRTSARCGCKATLRITLPKSFDIFLQEWQVTAFMAEHNHVLLSPSKVRFLPINLNITKSDQDRIMLLKE